MAWNAAAHPRYPNGKFRPKFSHGARLSPSSVSYSAGVRVPLVPGRANLYVGALARVEHAGGTRLFKRQTDRAVDSVARRFGDTQGRSVVAQVLKGNTINVRGLNVQGPKAIIAHPTFRVSSTPASRVANQAHIRRVRTRAPRASNARTPNLTSAIRASGAQTALASPARRPRKRRQRRKR